MLIGFCEECCHSIYETDEVPKYKGIYECPECGHPQTKDDMFSEQCEV